MKYFIYIFIGLMFFGCQYNKEKTFPKLDPNRYNVAFLIMNGTYNTEFTAPYDIFQHTIFRYSIKAMNVLAEEANLTHHIAMGQFFQAYTLVTLVDFFGDIPVTEALQGAENLNPNLEPGAQAYETALTLLDQAIANFGSDAAADPDIDLYYNGDWDLWIKASNTLKMKILELSSYK